jgi:LPXTG-site transpeptidase (sortase) family protein
LDDRLRKPLRIAGLLLIAAALCAIGYFAWSRISLRINEDSSLEEAEQLISDMNAYTGEPPGSAQPGGTAGPGTAAPSGSAAVSVPPNGAGDPGGSPEGSAGSKPTAGKDNSSGDTAVSGGRSGNKTPTKSTVIGMLIFDSLGGRKVPVLEGATAQQLSRGAAHHPSSSKPGAVGNCVIYGHRDTVFRSFGKLKVGDTIRLQVPGKTFTYRIIKMAVVEPGDPQIFHADERAVMTLVTCYPFNYIGAAPHRYMVQAVLQ